MHSSFSSLPVVLSLLRSLLSDEHALFAATHQASRRSTGPQRRLLEAQLQQLDVHLERIAWQLGSRGDCVLVGNTPKLAPDATLPELLPDPVRQLGGLHANLIQQLHRFAARTNRLGEPAIDLLLADLLFDHAGAALALRSADRHVA